MKKKKVIAIVQARMGSSRLPGKVLMEISGKPMLSHVVERLRVSKLIDQIVVATSVGIKDDPIALLCSRIGVDIYRGSENDVLNRYYETAEKFDADVIVRITSDCPLIDPQVADRVISRFLSDKDLSVVSNTVKRTYPRGLDTEVFSFESLQKTEKEAVDSACREHVTAYLYRNPDKFQIGSIENDKDLSRLRWTVDEEKDLVFVREIYKRLYKADRVFSMEEIVKVLRKEPDLENINMYVKQKVIFK